MIETFREGLPFSEEGFGVRRNVYVSGRMNVSVAEHGGIYRLGYLGHQEWQRFDLLSVPEVSVFTQLFRLHILIDGTAFRPEFRNTAHFPFGYRSECELGGVRIRHELIADNDTLFHRVRVLENPRGARVTARIVVSNSCFESKKDRTFTDWVRNFDDGTLSATVTDGASTTRIRIGCTGRGIFRPITQQIKIYLLSAESSDEHLFHLTFDPQEGRDLSSARIDRKFADFEALRSRGAIFETGSPAYDSALRFMPLLNHFLEVPDYPGAVRASPFYWVWGWDSMVHCDSLICAGYPEAVRRMLFFFKEAADPEFGIHMAYSTDLSPSRKEEPVPVQAFYLIMLYHYFVATGDDAVWGELRPFARRVAEKIVSALVPGVNLIRGRAYFPDFPHCIELTNHDFSTINNSVCYQGLRAWEELTGEFKQETEALGRAIRRFFDDSEGTWIDSLDGDTLEPRRYYPVYGQFYTSSFALEPHREDHSRTAEFMKSNLLSRYGVWMFPPDRRGFLADGGQLGEYFPAVDRSYWNLMNITEDSSSPADHERIVSAFWKNCTYPEGETTDVVNVDPSLYEDDPGMKQLFTARSWAASAVDLNLGLRWNREGFSLHPLPGKDFALRNMLLRGKRISFFRTGSGSRPCLIYGSKESDRLFIRWEELTDGMVIRIEMRKSAE